MAGGVEEEEGGRFASWAKTNAALWGAFLGGEPPAAAKLQNVFTDMVEATFERFSGAPALGLTREYQEKCGEASRSWLTARKAEAEYVGRLTEIGRKALESVGEKFLEKAREGGEAGSLHDLLDLWVETSEKAYFEAASTEAFAEAQGRCVNAAIEYRLRERELSEYYLKALHVPTRREVDDAYKHLAEVRREVRKLKKEVAELKSALPAVERPKTLPAVEVPALPAAKSMRAPAQRGAKIAPTAAQRTAKPAVASAPPAPKPTPEPPPRAAKSAARGKKP